MAASAVAATMASRALNPRLNKSSDGWVRRSRKGTWRSTVNEISADRPLTAAATALAPSTPMSCPDPSDSHHALVPLRSSATITVAPLIAAAMDDAPSSPIKLSEPSDEPGHPCPQDPTPRSPSAHSPPPQWPWPLQLQSRCLAHETRATPPPLKSSVAIAGWLLIADAMALAPSAPIPLPQGSDPLVQLTPRRLSIATAGWPLESGGDGRCPLVSNPVPLTSNPPAPLTPQVQARQRGVRRNKRRHDGGVLGAEAAS